MTQERDLSPDEVARLEDARDLAVALEQASDSMEQAASTLAVQTQARLSKLHSNARAARLEGKQRWRRAVAPFVGEHGDLETAVLHGCMLRWEELEPEEEDPTCPMCAEETRPDNPCGCAS